MLAASKLQVLSRGRVVKSQADLNESPFPWQRLFWINFQSFFCCDQHFFRNSPSLDSFAIVDLFCVCPTFTLTATGDVITSGVITRQWQLQCVDKINCTLFRVMIEKKLYRTAHIYITAFHAHFVRRECRVIRECRHSAEWRQCAERCANEIKVGHLKYKLSVHSFKKDYGRISDWQP